MVTVEEGVESLKEGRWRDMMRREIGREGGEGKKKRREESSQATI